MKVGQRSVNLAEREMGMRLSNVFGMLTLFVESCDAVDCDPCSVYANLSAANSGVFISNASSAVDMDISLLFGRQVLSAIVHSEAGY